MDAVQENIVTEQEPAQSSPQDPYSLHTFLLPFVYGEDNEEKREAFEALLVKNQAWVKSDWMEERLPREGSAFCSGEGGSKSCYAAYQYFNKAGRAAILGIDSKQSIVSQYAFEPLHNKKADERFVYRIETPPQEKGESVFELEVLSIRLHVYDGNVAILLLQMQNVRHRSELAVKRINQYGRRIRFPFIPAAMKYGETACALQLQLGKICYGVNFARQGQAGVGEDETPLHFMPDFILRLLDYGSARPWVTYSKRQAKTARQGDLFVIQPISDDRMFVACTICKAGFLDGYTKEKDGAYIYQSDYDMAKQLYALLFIDSSDASCQNSQMVQDLLANAIYDRWSGWGTMHAATHHSMFCLTGAYKDLLEAVIRPFQTLYVGMLALLLAQRARIIVLQAKASRLSSHLKEKKKDIEVKKLLALQQEYVAFQNQMLLFEVTPQEQGIEFYQLLRRQLYLPEEQERLEKQLHNLYELATIQQSAEFNHLATAVSFTALLLTVLSVVYGSDPVNWCRVGLCVVASLLGLFLYAYVKK